MPALPREPIIAHLRSLGVTAIELMPVHYFLDDRHLVDKGLRNYWGYNTLGFFAPRPALCRESRPARRGDARVQANGQGPAQRRNRGHPGCGLQPHRGGQSCRARRSRFAVSTTSPTTAWCRAIRATTWTSPAAATPSTWCIRIRYSCSWTAFDTGSPRCTWTAFASTLPPRSLGSSRMSISSAPSSTRSIRTRRWRRPN